MPPSQNQFPAPLQPNPNEPGHDPYAFFMEPQKAPRNSLFGGGASNQKLFMIAGAIVVFLILVVFLVSLSAGGNKGGSQLLSLAQSQQEVIRVAKDGTKNAQSTDLKYFAATTVISVTSDQRLLLADMAKSGKKVKPKDLDLGRNPQTDQALAAALAANTYDSTFASSMDSQLGDYINKLKQVAPSAGPSGQKLIKQEYDDASKLRTQLHTYAPSTPGQ